MVFNEIDLLDIKVGLRNITDNVEHHFDLLLRGGLKQVSCLLIETEKITNSGCMSLLT